ncbi:glucokinase [Amphiplicatus metriothermophilus]|uniref:Sensory/regulatory protein RpfC n=1 Tax=Amphiplicatus metriothermophilus TaxID=1519374 RepID=A0A239PW99_9PROT|nr:glucokinase [Amphiplicatus metriothermophilus]MBB5518983.1 glucokinase [Amphiplicatus metriothermophilus]SNT74591.1 glucokinase [Amphiplicatus metriothermophilus]
MSTDFSSALLADVGHDECRLALMRETAGERPSFAHNARFSSSEFPSLAALLRHYLSLLGDETPEVLGLSLAQPVTRDVIRLPSPQWTVDRRVLRDGFGFADVVFVNDTSAVASSLPWLGPHDVKSIGREEQGFSVSPEGRYSVMSLRYGLGIAALVGEGGAFAVVDSEGGHSGYAPQTPEEMRILAEMLKREPHVSKEMILASDGIRAIYTALCAANGDFDAKLSPLEIVLYGKTGAEETCRKALDLYFDMLASAAGDVALNLCAVDGLFICGEILNGVAEIMPHDRFRETFQRKGSFTDFVGRIPTYVVSNPSARLIGLARLISKRMEAQRRRAKGTDNPEKLLEEITAAIDQSITIVGPDLTIVACTGQPWYNQPGAPGAARAGQSAEAYLRALAEAGQLGLGEARQCVDGIVEKMKAGERFEFARMTFGGRLLHARAEPREGGGFIIIETDYTERDARTRELEGLAANLREAKMKSDAASRAKSEFLANMSHEIRTPLNGVLGMADVLQRTPLSESQAEILDVIIKSGNSLLTVINDILDFSKIEAGKLRLKEDPFDLRTTIEDVAAMFAAHVEKKDVELMVRVAPGTPANLIGDAGRLRQVLTNIVGNAVKFTDKGHILIDVAGAREGGRARLAIAVKDTGCGIPPEKIETVFDMFEQADGSATRAHQGTGLGLAITKRIVEAMGGAVRAESAVGEGTTFRIDLALPVHDHQEDDPCCAEIDPVDVSGARVLVVDDQEVNRQILCEQLQGWGMTPLSAAGGEEALATLLGERRAGAPVDLAVLDYQMPEMDGLALARRIKTHPHLSATPLVLLTSVGHVGDTDDRVYEDFAGYLVKPARAAQLLENIRRALSGGFVPRPAESAPAQEQKQAGRAPESAETVAVDDEAEPARPAAKAVAPAHAAPCGNGAAQPPQADEGGRKIKVFVVEDNLVNRRVVGEMLKNSGYELVELEDGEKAVAEYMNGPPDLILMDVSMPNLDGYAATRKIREIEKAQGRPAGVPIIGVTAHAMPEDRAKCAESGMNDYLAKPIRQEALEAAIRRHCA